MTPLIAPARVDKRLTSESAVVAAPPPAPDGNPVVRVDKASFGAIKQLLIEFDNSPIFVVNGLNRHL